MQPKHSAIVAGLTLALSFGAVTAPAPAAAEEPTPGVASGATDIDKGLYTQQSFSGVLRSVQGVSFVNVTPEMKYFTKYESHGNYNQGFSYGDGYNALGYYQFDRRWSLIPFMKQAYNYNPEKYSMLKDAIDRGSEISNTSNAMYENGQLTELGRIAQEAFQGAYNIDPVEFSALQDAYAYNSYYAVTEAWLKSGLGIDISGRADCVKGMVWSITNMCGTGGCRDFFRWANLSNSMTDREFVTALSNSVVNNVATKYSSQPQYHEGWKNRYRNELKDCLVYIAEDEAAATPVQPEPTPAPSPTPDSNDDSSDDANDDRMDAPSTGADGDGSAGGTTNNGSTSNGSVSNGSAAGDSSSSSAGNTDSDASGSTGAGTSNSSTGSSDSSVGTGSNNGSGSDATPGSDASKDDSNKAPDVPVASPDKKPSFSEQLGSTLGSSLMAGVNNGSTQNKGNSDQVSTEKIEAAKGDSKDKASEKTESDKGSSSEEKSDKSEQKKDEDKKSESEEKDKSKAEGEKKQSEDDDKSGADNQVQEQNDSKTVTTTTTTTTTTKSSGGNMPKTGDLIVMASLASASLATLGATSIVSGKHKLDQQKKASGEDGLEE